ncbi:MAG: hypothetical protein PVJ98_07095 [Akkermansiaceae bacterium]|jgi:hypothetical protein
MNRTILLFGALLTVLPMTASGQDDARIVATLRAVYQNWRAAMVRKDAIGWKRHTSTHRLVTVRNRIWSERRAFPNAVFDVPFAPPSLKNLKAMSVQLNGATAKATYFGKVDFGVGGKPGDNLWVISYIREAQGWKYDGGEFVKLDALPAVRKQLQAGDTTFLKGKDFKPDGVVKPLPVAIRGPVKYIAKTYVYCPGREVRLMVNGISSHLYQNTKRSEVIVGGARDGKNEVQFSIKDIPGGDPKAPIAIRVYLMSEVEGTKPIPILNYQIEDGSKPRSSGTLNFEVDRATARKLTGR